MEGRKLCARAVAHAWELASHIDIAILFRFAASSSATERAGALMEELNAVDVRVLGALIEKEATTPDSYPLSLNSLLAACNQTSNRQPVVSYDDDAVLASLTRLRRQSLVRAIQPADSRVMKYQQLLGELLNLSTEDLGVMCVLMLRGPQTAGEIKTRTERLAHFATLADVETTLDALIARSPALVVRLAKQPGQRDQRYAHLLSGEVAADAPNVVQSQTIDAQPSTQDRIAALEQTTTELRNELSDLRRQLETFRKQFE